MIELASAVATGRVRNGYALIRPPGHHATAEAGMGFCLFNKIAIAIAHLKAELGVPRSLAACHTGEVAGYVVEGHVPADAVKRLLAERPQARGLAVPGMPVGSPGMEVEGVKPDTYDVVLFGPEVQRAFARFRGTQEVT